jgi:hypothetical protein
MFLTQGPWIKNPHKINYQLHLNIDNSVSANLSSQNLHDNNFWNSIVIFMYVSILTVDKVVK